MDPKQESPLQKRTKIKKSYGREISNLRDQMDRRKQQRALTIYNLANLKFQNALIIARQLIYTSQKIWKEYYDQYNEEFEQTNFFRTSRNKEHTEYLLDSALICKVYLKSKKKDDILQVIQKIQIPQVQIIQKSSLVTKQDILKYNEMKQILSRTCAAFLSFIDITKQQKFVEYAEKLYQQYNEFVQKYYGPFEYATARFMYANYLYENQKFKRALQMFQICLKIRKQNCFNQAYVDVLVNSSVCMRQLGQIKPAIQRMISAIQISKDLKKTSQLVIDDYHLFLAKLYLENANFKQAYKNFLITYKMRSELHIQNPQRSQIQFNLLYFYKMLQKSLISGDQPYQQVFNLKERKEIQNCRKQAQQIMKEMNQNILNREQFSKYDDFNKKMAHLNLTITEQFFDLLSSQQANQLNVLLLKLTSCSFPKGINQLVKSSFFEQKKTRELLIASNPVLAQYKAKKQSI